MGRHTAPVLTRRRDGTTEEYLRATLGLLEDVATLQGLLPIVVEHLHATVELLGEVIYQARWLVAMESAPQTSVPSLATPAELPAGQDREGIRGRRTAPGAGGPVGEEAVRRSVLQSRRLLHKSSRQWFQAVSLFAQAALAEEGRDQAEWLPAHAMQMSEAARELLRESRLTEEGSVPDTGLGVRKPAPNAVSAYRPGTSNTPKHHSPDVEDARGASASREG